MKLIIFGATGGTGYQLVTQALEKGYEVTAFVRNPDKFQQVHMNLNVVKGDVLDLASVEQAVEGHDAVMCALGMPSIMDKSQLRSKATKNLVSAMEKKGVQRIVCLSALGAGDSHKTLPFRYKYLIAPLIMRHLYADHNMQENMIMTSQLEWSIARPGVLTDGKRTGTYQHGFGPENKSFTTKISRADTAHFMLKQLTDNQHVNQASCLSY